MNEKSNKKATSKYGLHPERITPEGFKRGTEVQFKDESGPHLAQISESGFKYGRKYIVISVFQPDATRSNKPEVTLRDENGDCYGYVPSDLLVQYDILKKCHERLDTLQTILEKVFPSVEADNAKSETLKKVWDDIENCKY